MVANALRRFSEDRTGMADFALESGGRGETVEPDRRRHGNGAMTCSSALVLQGAA